MDKNDLQLSLKQYNPYFINYEIPPGKKTIKDFSEVGYAMGDHGGTSQIEDEDFSTKPKLSLTHFGLTFGVLRFDEKLLFRS